MMTIKEIKDFLDTIEYVDDIPESILEDNRKGVVQALGAWRKKQIAKGEQMDKLQSMLSYEKECHARGYQFVSGIDEVGRGPLAGPVVACCIIMPEDDLIFGINDSKKVSAKKRNELYEMIMSKAISVGIGIVDEQVIDDINIYEATKLAMLKAIDDMEVKPDFLLIDAMRLDCDIEQLSIIKGDSHSYQIAASSIVAKVTRDRLMENLSQKYKGYGFEKNAGYGTKEHIEALKKYGVTPIHRKTFEPVKSFLLKM